MINYYCVLSTPHKGFSVFSNRAFESNELIEQYTSITPTQYREIIPKIWETHICRFCNHNDSPNTKLIKENNDWYLYSIEKINVGDEILVNYREVEKILNVSSNTFYKEHFINLKYNNFKVN